jgi:hypothetical protein
MPGYRRHLTWGLAVYAVLMVLNYEFALVDWSLAALGLPLFLFYTLLPDIDSPSSKIRKWVDVLILSVIIALIFFEYKLPAIILCMSSIVIHLMKHRGFFHNPLAALLLSGPIMVREPALGILAFIGYVAHLVADGLWEN